MNRDPIEELEKIRQEQQELRMRLREMDDRIADLRLSLAEKSQTTKADTLPSIPAETKAEVPPMTPAPQITHVVHPTPVPPTASIVSEESILPPAQSTDSSHPSMLTRLDNFFLPAQSTDPTPASIPTFSDEYFPPIPDKTIPPSTLVATSETYQEPKPTPVEATSEKPEKESFEVRVGRYWLPRIGIIILLTGLIRLSAYAYQHIIANLGAPGKLALLYMAAGILAGIGFWLGRKSISFRNYSRVLLAGGIAMAYYATYAAHYVATLRVIESPLVGGALLLFFAGAMAWMADRTRSQTVAFLAILLAYYTSAINAQEGFTVFSCLLLTIAAVVLMVRRGWTALSYLSLAGTYLSFAYWQFYQAGHLFGGLSAANAWSGCAALACYWALFTGAVFLRQPSTVNEAERGTFLTINNGAFFALASPLIHYVAPDGFWMFILGFGIVLVALSQLAKYTSPEKRTFDSAYFAQGLLFITIGLITRWIGGYQLAIFLALESGFLLAGSRRRYGIICGIGATLTAFGAFILATWQIWQSTASSTGLMTAAVVAILFLGCAWYYKWQRTGLGRFQFGAACYVLMTMLISAQLVLHKWGGPEAIVALSLLTVASTFAIYIVRMPEIPILGQGFLLLAFPIWLFNQLDRGLAWQETTLLLVITLVLIHWWQWQRRLSIKKEILLAGQCVYSLILTVLLFTWLAPQFSGDNWMIVCGVLAVLILAHGQLTKVGPLAAVSLIFTAASVGSYFLQHVNGDPGWIASLITIALFTIQPVVAGKIGWPSGIGSGAVLWRIVSAAMTLTFIVTYSAEEWLFTSFAALVAIVFLIGALRKNREWLIYAAVFTAIAFICFWVRQITGDPVFLPDFAGLLLMLSLQQLGKRLLAQTSLFPSIAQNLLIVVGTISLWLLVTRLVWNWEGLSLTIAWSLLAFSILTAGFLLQEKLYRHLGLGLIGLSVARIALDVWRMDTVMRNVGFVVLGIVILAVSYLYNRHAAMVKKWF